MSVLLLAALLSFAVLGLENQRKQRLHELFADLFAAIMAYYNVGFETITPGCMGFCS